MTDRSGNTTRFDYRTHPLDEARKILDGVTDPRGQRVLAHRFNSEGRPAFQLDADGHAIQLSYDLPNRRHAVTNRLGHTTTHFTTSAEIL